jgi:succinoglycan biosynthesis protein ExoM
VCIAIPTYRREALLRALFDGLRNIDVPSDCDVHVVVFDNDAEETAASTVAAVRPTFPFPLEYVSVPEPGLASVRNRALDIALSRFHYLAMIDDDECPEKQWLCELLRIQEISDADAVIGSVPQTLPGGVAGWIRAGAFFDLPVYKDGASMTYGYSGNCLLKTSTIVRCGVRFDVRLNFAGGEDMLFFKQLYKERAKIVYAAHAVAVERVHHHRLNAAYILAMQFRRGNTLAICDRRLDGSGSVLWLRAMKSLVRIAFGLVMAVPFLLLRGQAGWITAIGTAFHGAGALSGLMGYIFLGYKRKS